MLKSFSRFELYSKTPLPSVPHRSPPPIHPVPHPSILRLRPALHSPFTPPHLRGPCLQCRCPPTLWNSLPAEIRNAPSLNIFKSTLKTHLFNKAFQH
ncbi:hypothetical protein OYC64_020783 [Pagothenia borchgrevinki]|uniref:Uncharacterized protein n=1 Tax=Pagothenia borchgrevinki TaxID=8213 RepID=A0ABD2FPW5_PAGBO